jgi:tetratricopeptide (TPR) repeat protein
VDDSTASLQLERSFKALLRRSNGYFHLGRYQDSVQDVDEALEMQPDNKEALDLRKKVLEKWKEVDGTRFGTKVGSKKTKLTIVETEEESVTYPPMNNWKGPIITEIVEEKKVVFEDVDDEDSSDED